jgi:hypothetical protein
MMAESPANRIATRVSPEAEIQAWNGDVINTGMAYSRPVKTLSCWHTIAARMPAAREVIDAGRRA